MKSSKYNRIYLNDKINKGQTLILQSNHSHYLKSVLRLKIGHFIRLFNEIDGEFLAQINNISKNTLSLEIIDKNRELEKDKKLILALSIIKPDPMIHAIKSAVQIGVTDIIPIISSRTQYQEINYDRLEKIIIESTEQSERFAPSKLHSITKLQDFCSAPDIEQIIFANENEKQNRNIKDIHLANQIAVLIGPEGGFSQEEQEQISQLNHSISISLGKNILKSETAAVACLACISMMR